jgi:hypothetical protein
MISENVSIIHKKQASVLRSNNQILVSDADRDILFSFGDAGRVLVLEFCKRSQGAKIFDKKFGSLDELEFFVNACIAGNYK